MFEKFPKIPRLCKECVVTEKIDGTNAQIFITEILSEEEADTHESNSKCIAIVDASNNGDSPHAIYAGSRKRLITPDDDNFGFAAWVRHNAVSLVELGPGRHFGEWWGKGIQRGYGLDEKRFSLFNVGRWTADVDDPDKELVPYCCHVVPILAVGDFSTVMAEAQLERLREDGSVAASGYMNPEGIVLYHTAAQQLFKYTLDGDHK